MRPAIFTLVLAAVALPSVAAFADPTCTDQPQAAWKSEAELTTIATGLGYHDLRSAAFTDTACFEIYGFDAEGHRAEVYFDPVTGAVVEAEIDD